MQLGLSHVVFDVLGSGESNCELLDPEALESVAEGVIVDGPNSSSREIIAPVFSMKEDPVSGRVLQESRVGRGRGDGRWEGRRFQAEFAVRLEDETLEMVAVPSARNVAPVQEARNIEVVLLPRVLLHISPEETINNANNHLGRVVGRRADVVVEIHGLLEDFSQKVAIFNPDCEV